jgi:phage-related protein
MYNTALRLKIIRVTYNVLLDRYDQMELGDKPTTYTAVLEKMYDSKVAGVEAGLKSIAVDIQTAQQIAMGRFAPVKSRRKARFQRSISQKSGKLHAAPPPAYTSP